MRYLLLALGLYLSPLSLAHGLGPLKEAEDRREPQAPALREAALSPNEAIRIQAAHAFGRIQKPFSVAPLLGLLRDKKPKVIEAALFALGQLGWQRDFSGGQEMALCKEIAPLTKNANLGIRTRAVEALGKLGLENAPTLLSASLADTHDQVRAEALMAIFRARLILRARNPEQSPADLPADIVSKLAALTKDRHSQVRQNLAYLLAKTKDARLFPIAAKLARDQKENIRLYAVGALGKNPSPEALSLALESIQDAKASVRTAAINAVIANKGVSQLNPNLVRDPDWFVRDAYATALGELEAAAQLPLEDPLLLLWQDKSQTVRSSALKSLVKRYGVAASPQLELAFADRRWLLREAAVQAAAGLKEKAEVYLLRGANDQDVRVRAAALESLAAIPTESAFAAISHGLSSSSLAERGSAITALTDRTEAKVLDLAWNTYKDSSDRKWIEMRESLVDILAKFMNETATSYLREALKDPASSVAFKAEQALIKRGEKDFPTLAEPSLSFSPFRELQFKRRPRVTLITNKGSIEILCFSESAPIHVASFVGQAKAGFYNGLIWHRVIPNFVVQGGDPDGSGWGDAGYSLRAEINEERFVRGSLGMPRSQGFDTGGVQIFISHVPVPHLDGQYTVFGKVIRGLDVIDKLERADQIISAKVKE